MYIWDGEVGQHVGKQLEGQIIIVKSAREVLSLTAVWKTS